MPQLISENIQAVLRQYWNDLPLVKKIDKSTFNFLRNDNRSKIVSVLSRGVKDFDELRNEFIRHALTVQEIQSQIKETQKCDITETNTHFHIQKLIDKGFVKEIIEIKTGRRPKKYFGRTAKIFLDSGESDKYNIEEDDFTIRLIDLITKINPSLEKSVIQSKFEDFKEKKSKLLMEKIDAWMEKYNSEILESEIEFKQLFLYIFKALTHNNEFSLFFSEILEMLDYSH